MDIIEIKSFDQLISVFLKTHPGCGHVIYRGVRGQNNQNLIPSVGRISKFHKTDLEALIKHEQGLLNQFRHRAYSELIKIPHNDWVWLALAQHHGLSTRLLDWTFSPLVAAFFATEPELDPQGSFKPLPDDGGLIYILHDRDFIDAYTTDLSPFEVKDHRIVYAPVVTNRIAGQGGLFTVQPDPRQDFQLGFENKSEPSKWIHQLKFTRDVALEIQKALYILGIRKGGIYPDFEGFGEDTNIRFSMPDCESLRNPKGRTGSE